MLDYTNESVQDATDGERVSIEPPLLAFLERIS